MDVDVLKNFTIMAVSVFDVVAVLELPPGQYLGEAEEHEGGEIVSSAAAVEADSETATPSVEAEGGHVVVMGFLVHGAKVLN